jgi:predicted nucleic acid-binding protein
VILADSSAWIDYLANRSTPAVEALVAAIRAEIALLCEPVWAELTRGARDEREQKKIESALAAVPVVTTTREDWENAATIGRITSRHGVAIRSFMDCLIAGIAVRSGATVLHSDVDFERIAGVFPLLDQTRG